MDSVSREELEKAIELRKLCIKRDEYIEQLQEIDIHLEAYKDLLKEYNWGFKNSGGKQHIQLT